MNLRQKHKKLKKELERYKRLIVRPSIVYPTVQYEIRTVAVDRILNEYEARGLEEEDVIDILLDDLLDYVKDVISVYSYNSGFEKHYQAELKIAIPKTRT